MKEAISQGTAKDASHSRVPEGNGCNSSNKSLKSAAMLGLALSVGASGALPQGEAIAAMPASATPATTEAFSSDSSDHVKASANSTETAAAQQIVAYHTVETGESLWQIAQQHRVGLRELKGANALPPETSIRIGQVLKVPSRDTQAADASSELVARVTADEPAIAESDSSSRANKLSRLHNTISPTAKESLLIAQSAEAGSPQTQALQTEASATEPTAISIEIANAPPQASPVASTTAPVVTALAAPAPASHYRVQVGDTLNTIASSLGTTSSELIRANALANPNVILVGDTLRVPASATRTSTPIARKPVTPILVAESAQPTDSGQRLMYLRETAVRPETARMLESMPSAAPDVPASVGREEATANNSLGSQSNSAESIDPYVENLLEEVQQVRTQSAQISEIDASQESAVEADSALLARTERPAIRPSLAERVRRTSAPAAAPAAAESAGADLLAAAPISPDAYIPAQRSASPQVVSPDMPILPEAGEFLPEVPNYFDGFIWPTQGTLTSGYGWRWGRMHRGVDVAGPVGTPIVAAGTGVVEQAGWNSGGYGNLVEIRHPDGSLTRYAHNSRLSVSSGQAVKQGQKIAEMGSTGYSTGPHLHFEVHQSNGAVNPIAYLPNR